MAHNFLAALEAEIADLEADLSRDLRFVRLQQLRKAQLLYTNPEAVASEGRPIGSQVITAGRIQTGTTHPTQAAALAAAKAMRPVGRRASAEKMQALEAVASHLEGKSSPVATRDLLEHLTDLGIEIGGASPLNNLSAMLSNSERFVSHGRSGWTVQPDAFDEAASIEAMDKVSSEFAEDLTDEGLHGLRMHISKTNLVPEDVVSRLKDAYYELTGHEYVGDDRNLFRKALDYHLSEQAEHRSNSFLSET